VRRVFNDSLNTQQVTWRRAYPSNRLHWYWQPQVTTT